MTDTIFASGEDVIAEWTLHHTVSEPLFGGLSRRTPVELHGVSVVRAKNGNITHWSEYYDGLTARRTALAFYFTDWVEL